MAIIGAGKMGRWLTRFFLEEDFRVIVSDKDERRLSKIRDEFHVEVADNTTAVKGVDWVLIAVPISSFEGVIKEIHPHVQRDQVVMDICSVKELPVKTMHKYIRVGTTLGTHPMFGPGAKSVENQNFILTPTNAKEREFAKSFKGWLEDRRATVLVMSPRRHDRLMSTVLGLPHFVGVVLCDTLLGFTNLAETKKAAGTTYKILLALAESIASEEPDFYADLQVRLPQVEEIEGAFYEKAGEWLDIVRRKDKSAFAEKMRVVKTRMARAVQTT